VRLDSFSQWEEVPKLHAWVLPALLGLSPTSNGGHTLKGDIIREFVHAVTGDDMLVVYFGCDWRKSITEEAMSVGMCRWQWSISVAVARLTAGEIFISDGVQSHTTASLDAI